MATTTALLMMAAEAAITLNSGYRVSIITGCRLKHVTASTNYFWGVDTRDFIYMHACASVLATVTGTELVAS